MKENYTIFKSSIVLSEGKRLVVRLRLIYIGIYNVCGWNATGGKRQQTVD